MILHLKAENVDVVRSRPALIKAFLNTTLRVLARLQIHAHHLEEAKEGGI